MDYRLWLSDGSYREMSMLQLKDQYERGAVRLRDIAERDGEHWLVGEILGESLGSFRYGLRRTPVPRPPAISWWTVALLGGITGGYGLAFVAVLQGLWSRRIQKRLPPVLLPVCSLLLVPAHLAWSITSMVRDHPPIGRALVHLLAGFLVTEALAVVCVALASLSLRKSLLARLGKEGFEMSWVLTAALGPAYVAYKARELSETCS